MAADTDEDVSERRLLGQALRALRDRARLTQDDAAEAYAVIAKPRGSDEFTAQAWGKYEAGKRTGVHAPAVQAKLAAAVRASREELLVEMAKLRGGNPSAVPPVDRQPVFGEFPQFSSQRMIMPDDNLRPWSRSGETIVYDIDRWPSADEGCVLEPLGGGKKLVKIFLRADDEHFHVAEIFPERREFTLPRDGFNAYKVVARLA